MSIIDDTPFLDDAPPADYIIRRVRQLRQAGEDFDTAVRAAYAEGGRFETDKK